MTTETDTAESTEQTAEEPEEQAGERDAIARLADRGEETIRRLAELPGGQRALRAFHDLRERVDDLSRRMRGVDELEIRVQALERRVDALDGGAPPAGPNDGESGAA